MTIGPGMYTRTPKKRYRSIFAVINKLEPFKKYSMIRAYQLSDTEAIIDVWYKASSLAHPFLSKKFMEKEKKNIRELYLPNTKTWVYEAEGNLVGFISMIDNEIGAIFLEPTYHGRGMGKAMLNWVKEIYPRLEVEVFKANPIGRAFYDRNGFQFMREYTHEETNQPVLRLSLLSD